MRAVIQRVNHAKVTVAEKVVGEIKTGLLIFLGVTQTDSEKDVDYLVSKIANLRIFPKDEKEFDVALLEMSGEALVVSQFTLYGNCTSGRRPDFIYAAKPDFAKDLYEKFVQQLKSLNIKTETGIFGADMKVSLENDGPVTFIVESKPSEPVA
jgi:D-tyrosyl-tRNA(Tyr) deacylase